MLNSFAVFLVVALALAVASALWVAWPLLRPRAAQSNDPDSGSISADEARRLAVLRDRRQEIEHEHTSGRLTRAEADATIEQLVVELGQAMATPGKSTVVQRRPWLAAGVSVAVVLVSFGLYLMLGAPRIITLDPMVARGETTPEQFAQAMAELNARAQRNPADLEAWVMLAQGYRAQGDLAAAASAFKRATELAPPGQRETARLFADYAETLLTQNSGRFEGLPMSLLEQALKNSPDDQKALGLIGAGLYRTGKATEGLRYLRQLLAQLPQDSDQSRQIAAVIQRIEAEALGQASPGTAGGRPAPGGGTLAPAAEGPGATGTSAPAAPIRGRITVASNLSEHIPRDATIFIIARSTDGQRMPIAVSRQPFQRAPFEFEIGDEQSMTAQRKLSQLPEVVLEARLSGSGQAARQPGDLFGVSRPIPPGAAAVEIIIDQIAP